jgi:hypothetical protein
MSKKYRMGNFNLWLKYKTFAFQYKAILVKTDYCSIQKNILCVDEIGFKTISETTI